MARTADSAITRVLNDWNEAHPNPLGRTAEFSTHEDEVVSRPDSGSLAQHVYVEHGHTDDGQEVLAVAHLRAHGVSDAQERHERDLSGLRQALIAEGLAK